MKDNSVNYIWINRIKIIACILVLLGHYLSGLQISGIIANTHLLQWFSNTIYCFHVPLFFICSGFLYQKKTIIESIKDWRKNVIKKMLDLGVPYVFFSTLTIAMKALASNSVNNEAPPFFKTIFFDPIAPYWYLYVLFFLFVVIVPFSKKINKIIVLIIAVLLKVLYCIFNNSEILNVLPYFLKGIMSCSIWFVAGMWLAYNKKDFDFSNDEISKYIILFILCVVISIVIYNFSLNIELIKFLLGMLFCISIVGIVIQLENRECSWMCKFLTSYTMEIFLMHTIFAAFIRIFLLKLNITNSFIHILCGLIASICFPILVAKIIKKSDILIFLIYPNKVLKRRSNKINYENKRVS